MNEFILSVIWVLFIVLLSRDKNLLYVKGAIQNNNRQEFSKLAAVITCLPLLLWATYRGDHIGDTITYKHVIREIPDKLSMMGDFYVHNDSDKGFSFFVAILKSFFGNNYTIIFFVIALISIWGVSFLFRKYSPDYAFSIMLFVISTDYISWMLNGVRQFMAVAILVACTPLILKKKYWILIFIVLLTSTIHGSAILFLPFAFICRGKAWNKKTIAFILGTLLIVSFVSEFTNVLDVVLENTQYSQTVSYFELDDGTNFIRVIVYAMPMLLSLFGKRKIEQYNSDVINFCVNMSIVTTGFYVISYFTSGIFMGRLPIYFSLYNYILLPWEVNNLFMKNSRRLLSLVIIGFYLIFYWYQLHIGWGYI